MENESGTLVYQAPTLTVYGSFESLTQGLSDGFATDAAFPIGTPKTDLTFS
jgi:hypothetical protein